VRACWRSARPNAICRCVRNPCLYGTHGCAGRRCECRGRSAPAARGVSFMPKAFMAPRNVERRGSPVGESAL
jgi:hypothetical protein